MNAPAKETGWHALNVDLEPSAREAVDDGSGGTGHSDQ